jgi:hypothetical protein
LWVGSLEGLGAVNQVTRIAVAHLWTPVLLEFALAGRVYTSDELHSVGDKMTDLLRNVERIGN